MARIYRQGREYWPSCHFHRYALSQTGLSQNTHKYTSIYHIYIWFCTNWRFLYESTRLSETAIWKWRAKSGTSKKTTYCSHNWSRTENSAQESDPPDSQLRSAFPRCHEFMIYESPEGAPKETRHMGIKQIRTTLYIIISKTNDANIKKTTFSYGPAAVHR